jgi:hypothetical protein
MLDLFKASRKKGFILSDKSIDAAFRRYLKEGIRSDIKQYIEQGDLIVPLSDILGACFVKSKTEIAPFDAGFDIDASFTNRIFKGVREDGNAYKAGLRNGQKWVKGGLTRDPAVLAEFIVEESGTRKNVKYYPAGNNKTVVPQFELKTGENQQNSPTCQSWFGSKTPQPNKSLDVRAKQRLFHRSINREAARSIKTSRRFLVPG